MKKIRIVQIINSLEIGGAEKVLLFLLKELKQYENLEISVVSLEGHGSLAEKIRELGIEVKEFKYRLFIPLLSRLDPYFRFRLFFYLLKKKPDLIHGHLIRGEDFAKTFGAILGIPVITTVHDAMIWPGRRQKFLNHFLSRAVAVSGVVAEHLKNHYSLPEEKITVIPDAIDLGEFKNSGKKFDPKKPVFLYLGRIFPTKGLDFTIEGLAKLLPDFPGLKLLVFGKEVFKGDQAKLEKMIKENGWNFVEFRGQTKDVPKAFSEGDIFVLASKTEGFAMSVLEAAAAGKPIIATHTGSIPEMIKEGETGYFVNYGSAEEINLAAKKILEGNVEAMGQKSAEYVKDKFSLKKIAKMYYNLYLQTIKERDDK